MWTATKEEIEYITSQYTLQMQAPLNLSERCKLFHRNFPNRVVKPKELSKIMKSCGITNKCIKTVSAPQLKQSLYDKHAKRTVELWNEIHEI